MKKTLITLSVILASVTTVLADNHRPVQISQLPQQAQAFLNSHFKGGKIAMVTAERELLGQDYNVVFANGDKVEFDSKGNLENIERRHSAVPRAAVPAAISKYLDENFPGTQVREIDLDFRGYDVELSNGLDIEFDKNFLVREIDR